MPFTFECGVCNSVYRLDDEQVTSTGVKVTCPKCLNFFLLKRGTQATEAPIVEHIVPDGPREVEPAMEKSRPALPPAAPKRNEAIADRVIPLDRPEKSITRAELADLPPDPPKATTLDQVLVPVALILVLVAGMLFLNYRGLVQIPGMQRFRAAPAVSEPIATPGPAATPSNAKPPKYGFPVVDPNSNSWSDGPQATPAP